MKKRIWPIISLLLLIVEFTPAIAQIRPKPMIYDYWQDGIYYRWYAGGAEVIYCDPELRAVSIPSEVKGMKVTRIGEMAYQYSDLVSVVLPESITVIDSMAFFGCDNLSSINFPAGLTRIGKKAFQGCTSLKSISLSDSLTEMRDGVFSGCNGLTSVVFPPGLTDIGNNVFFGCYSLQSVALPEKLTRIGSRAFYSCHSLKTIDIPESVKSIGEEAFYCRKLDSIALPKQLKRIEKKAFNQCEGLYSVTIPDSVVELGEQAFAECTGLTSVTLPTGLTSLESGVFEGCGKLRSVAMPDSVKSIADLAFFGCKALASVRLPAGLESIGISSFEGCEELTSIVLPSSVRRIGPRAYYGCPIKELYVGGNLEPGALADLHWLTDATLGSQVTDASSVRWSDCDSLATLRVLATTPPAAGEFSNKQYMNVEVRVPEGTLALYQAADGWKNFWNLQESSFTGISVAGAAATFRVRADGGHIVVEQAKGPVSVYDMAGRLVGRATADGGRAELAVPDGGTYIVKAGDTAVKIAL